MSDHPPEEGDPIAPTDSRTHSYMQFHPLAYMVKLNIEMSMAELIAKVAKQRRLEMWEHEDISNNTTFGNMTQATTTTTTGQLSHVSTNRSHPGRRVRKAVHSVLHRSSPHGSSKGSRGSTYSYTELETQRLNQELQQPQLQPQRPPDATVCHRHHDSGGSGASRGSRGHSRGMGIYTTREVHIEYEANPLHAAAPWTNPPALSNGALRGRASSFGSPDRNSCGKEP